VDDLETKINSWYDDFAGHVIAPCQEYDRPHVYVASSWRNERQPEIVKRLREAGYGVYDFRNPAPGQHGFDWSEIDPNWQSWSSEQFRRAVEHPLAETGYELDYDAICDCSVLVMVQPCGVSSALELGLARGMGKWAAVLLAEGQEPELMLKMAHYLATDLDDLLAWMERACVIYRGFLDDDDEDDVSCGDVE